MEYKIIFFVFIFSELHKKYPKYKIYNSTYQDFLVTREYNGKILHQNITSFERLRAPPLRAEEEEFELNNYVF